MRKIRKGKKDPLTEVVPTRLKPETLKKVDRLANEKRWTRSYIVRVAVEEYVDHLTA